MSVAEARVHAALRGGAAPQSGLPFVRLIPTGHSARILDAAAGMLLVYRVAVPGIPMPIPQLAMALLIGIALFRRPTRSFSTAWWYPTVMPLLLLFLIAETLFNGIDPWRRAANLAVMMLFAGLMASGRIDIGSVIKGLGIALALNFVLFYVGIAPDSYAGKLTGYLQDKNAGALIYAVGAILCTLITRKLWARLLILAAGAVAIVASDSRTTIAAYGVAATYLLVSTWLQRGFQLITLLAGVLVFLYADDNLTRLGDYAIDRKGSDAFRMRIDFASSLKAQAAPWYGSGLGESTVNLDSGTWFFHNSYQALIVEGGVVLLVVMLGAYAITGLGLSNRGFVDPMRMDARAVTAATLVLFLCAARLGEVFFAPIGFVVLGVGLARLLVPIDTDKQWWTRLT